MIPNFTASEGKIELAIRLKSMVAPGKLASILM
jgi:hypothetical protein